jgi:CheY-like chemotaxis protein
MILDAHETTVVTTGRAALERVRHGESFDVIVCDLGVADIDGPALYARLHEERPGLEKRLVFMTGAAWTARAAAFVAAVPNRRLEKPFDPEELLDAIDAVASA